MNTKIILAYLATVLVLIGVFYTVQKQKQAVQQGVKNPMSFLQDDSEAQIKQLWITWRTTYQKTYGHEDMNTRYLQFKQNYQLVKEHNAEFANNKSSFQLGLNEFADLSNLEFRILRTGFRNDFVSPRRVDNHYRPVKVPASVDWRLNNSVTPVKNQGSCGSCWAFSATGALEGLYAIKNGNLSSFSEQQLVDCSTAKGNEGCNGGLMDYAFSYVKDNGITTEDKYPYVGRDQTCKQASGDFKINGWTDVPQNSSAAMKSALAQGPVAVAIEADGFWFQLYWGGVFDHRCGTNLDHGVLAVGYGTEKGKDFYIVKNSWGGHWGEKGYIRFAIHAQDPSVSDPGMCGIHMSASQPTL